MLPNLISFEEALRLQPPLSQAAHQLAKTLRAFFEEHFNLSATAVLEREGKVILLYPATYSHSPVRDALIKVFSKPIAEETIPGSNPIKVLTSATTATSVSGHMRQCEFLATPEQLASLVEQISAANERSKTSGWER